MSIRIMNYVWGLGDMTHGEKLVLLCLADNANNDGVCWPSVNDVSARSLTDNRYIYNVLSSLEKKGHISRTSRRGKSTVYQLITPVEKDMGKNCNSPVEKNRGKKDKTPVEKDRTDFIDTTEENRHPPLSKINIPTPVENLHSPPHPPICKNHHLNHQGINTQNDFFEENGNNDSENPPPVFSVKDFYEFWKVYPSKVGKEAALKKFKLLVKSGNKPEMLIEAAVRYGKSQKVQKGFVCNPFTWLNEGRYLDEYPAAAAAIPEDIDLQKARILANSRAYLAKAVMEENRNKIAWWQSQFTEEKKAWLENYELKNGVVSPLIETGRGYEA